LTRLTLAGAIYVTAVCLLPEFLSFTGTCRFILAAPLADYRGGVMDFMAQVQAHMMSHQYDSLLKKANLKAVPRCCVDRRRQDCLRVLNFIVFLSGR